MIRTAGSQPCITETIAARDLIEWSRAGLCYVLVSRVSLACSTHSWPVGRDDWRSRVETAVAVDRIDAMGSKDTV